jgi:eukaryotic-like serine/threonine-protein kinase
LTNYYPERPVITPPPQINVSSDANGNALTAEDVPNRGGFRPRELSSRRKRAKQRAVRIILPSLAVLIGVIYLFFTFRPDLAQSMVGYFTASPTTTFHATQLASINTNLPTAPAVQPLLTQSSPTEAVVPSPEPSITPTLLITEPAIIPTPTSTPVGGGLGQIAFASDRYGVMQVVILDAATLRTRQVTNMKDGACQPTWSPDGMRLAFTSPCSGKQDTYPGSNIYTINLNSVGDPDKNSVTQITSSLEGDFDPAWAPDGKRLAFTSLRTGKPSIYVLNLEEKPFKEQVLSIPLANDRQPAWAPGGMQIAFVHKAIVSTQIWFMDDNGQIQKQFSPTNPANNSSPVWSVDGQVIFYSQTSPDPGSTVPVLVYKKYEDRVNNTETRIPSTAQNEIGPVAGVRPSPDGFWLAYEGWPDGSNHDIFMMNINGSNLKRLTTDPGYDFGPVWRPTAPTAH